MRKIQYNRFNRFYFNYHKSRLSVWNLFLFIYDTKFIAIKLYG